jgi:hypothetical protein
MVATERFGWATGWIEASGQESAVGRAAILQAVTRVKPEQASKVKSWMPTRQLTGEGRANGEETDKHLFGPSGYWARHARKAICVIGGDPGLAEVAPSTSSQDNGQPGSRIGPRYRGCRVMLAEGRALASGALVQE